MLFHIEVELRGYALIIEKLFKLKNYLIRIYCVDMRQKVTLFDNGFAVILQQKNWALPSL